MDLSRERPEELEAVLLLVVRSAVLESFMAAAREDTKSLESSKLAIAGCSCCNSPGCPGGADPEAVDAEAKLSLLPWGRPS